MSSNIITLQIVHTKWRELGVVIIQELVQMGFGTSFIALDPDGHRLRVFCYEKSCYEKTSSEKTE